MSSRPSCIRPWMLLLLLLGTGCKQCNPPDEVPDVVVDNTDIPSVESRLQVVSIDPSTSQARKPFPAHIYGSGFQPGATVHVGNIEAGAAEVVDENTVRVAIPALNAGTWDVKVANPDGAQSTLRQGLTIRGALGEDCRHVVVYFDLDKHSLTTEAQGALNQRIGCYQGGEGPVRVEGHADERGTTDYNLALGQRRADAVKRHLTGQGVGARRIHTVSYGEERPASTGHDEVAWSKNRRAELHASE